MRLYTRRPVLAWALYDWANSAFATTVMAGFFPAFFQRFWSLGVDPTVSTSRLGFANGVAGFVVPGTRVDVVVTIGKRDDSVSRVIVGNAQVLTAGTKYDQDQAKDGKPVPAVQLYEYRFKITRVEKTVTAAPTTGVLQGQVLFAEGNAPIVGAEVGAVKVRLHRARRKLRALLEPRLRAKAAVSE